MQTGLRQLASPFLHDLYGATLATVHLAVRDGVEVLYLDRLAGNASVPVVSSIGSRLPLHATGVGKVLLAHAPAEVQTAVLSDLRRITPYTITQPGTLRRQLARVHRDGYATTVEEMSLGACSVAVPIRDGAGRGGRARHRGAQPQERPGPARGGPAGRRPGHRAGALRGPRLTSAQQKVAAGRPGRRGPRLRS